MKLKSLFNPVSIAVVGASANPQKLGHQVFKKLLTAKIKAVYPVNPHRKKILAHQVYPDLTAVPGQLDQAVVAIPAPLVPAVARQAATKKLKSLVVLSAGFAETGPQGKKLEQELKTICRQADIALLGPNCLGYANLQVNLDLTFAKTAPPAGNIALVSQSGAIGSFLFDWAKTENLGFSQFISLGNRAGIDENDCLNYLVSESSTKVIGLYLESFANGSKFLKTAALVSRKKPIIVLFGGQTKTGKQAVQSHTAALSPTSRIAITAIKQAGCIPAESLEQFTDLLEIFSLEPPLLDNDLVIVTNAGGPGILASDEADRVKLDLTPLTVKTTQKLAKTLPSTAQLNNPVDLLGDAMADRFYQALQIITQDRLKDAFLIILTPQTGTQLEATCQAIARQFKQLNKAVVVSLLGGQITQPAKQILQTAGIATIDFPQKAVNALKILYHYWHHRRHRLPYPVRQTSRRKISQKKILQLKFQLKPGPLTWRQIKKLSSVYRLPVVKTEIATQANLDTIIKQLGFPLVLKSDPAETVHRTEKKALYLNLKSRSALKKAYQQLSKNFVTVLAQPQVKTGIELFIGAKKEPGFPPLITLGSGGIYTEIYRDVTHAFLPLNKKLVLQLLNQTKIGQIIQGTRGQPPLALTPVINLLLNLSQLLLNLPQISELDINPAIVDSNQVQIVDIKINLASPPTHL